GGSPRFPGQLPAAAGSCVAQPVFLLSWLSPSLHAVLPSWQRLGNCWRDPSLAKAGAEQARRRCISDLPLASGPALFSAIQFVSLRACAAPAPGRVLQSRRFAAGGARRRTVRSKSRERSR